MAALALLRLTAQPGRPGLLIRDIRLHSGAALLIVPGTGGKGRQIRLQILAVLPQRLRENIVMILLALILQHQILRLALLGGSHLQLVLGLLQFPRRLLRLGLGGGQLLLHTAQLSGELLQFIGTAEHAGAAADAAAGHGAAPIHHLSVQRDNAKSIAILAGHGDTAVQILHHHGAAQQVPENTVILLVIGDQIGGDAHKAVFTGHILPQRLAADGRHGQEGGPAAGALLQVTDGGFAVLLALHHNILHSAAQRDLQRHGVLLLRLHQAGHRAANAPQALFLRRLHHQLDGVGEALVLLFHLHQQPDAIVQRRHVHGQLQFLRLRVSGALFATLHLQAVALNDIADRLRFLLRLVQKAAVLFGFLFALRQLFLRGGQLRFRPLPAFFDLPKPGTQRRQFLLAISGGRQQQRLLRPQGFRRAAGAGGTVGQRLHLPQQLLQLPLQCGALCVDLLDALHLSVHPGLQTPGAAGRILHLPAHTVDILLIVLHRRAQNGDGAVVLAGSGLQLSQPGTERLRLQIVLPHLLAQFLHGGIGGFQLRLRPLLIGPGRLHIGLQLELGGLEVLQLLQPQADLQHTQLIPQYQILLGHLRLLAQRLHLQLQLRDLVIDAHQILLGTLQLALGLFLAVAVLADTCRLLKHLPALSALDGQYLVDLTLSDNGVALPAHAGVHKQLVHVLEPYRLLIDIVLRLAAAVIAPGNGHLGLVPGEDMLGVVDHQRHLRKAHLAALFRAAEDHILHLGAAKLTAVLFAHDPADRVGNVGLAGAVGTHNGGDILSEIQNRLIGKRLEALDFKCFQVQILHLILHWHTLTRIVYQKSTAFSR